MVTHLPKVPFAGMIMFGRAPALAHGLDYRGPSPTKTTADLSHTYARSSSIPITYYCNLMLLISALRVRENFDILEQGVSTALQVVSLIIVPI